MIVNEIAKFEKALQPRWRSCLSPISASWRSSSSLNWSTVAIHAYLPSFGGRPPRPCDKRCAGPTYGRRDPKPGSRMRVKGPMPRSADGSSNRSSRRAWPNRRAPAAARRRDHQPQLPRPLRRRRLRDPGPRQGHLAARDRPRGRADRERARGRGRDRARRSRRCSTTRSASSPSSSRASGMSAERAARARDARRGGALAARHPRPRRAAADRASTPSGSSRPTPRPRRRAARRCPTPTSEAHAPCGARSRRR